MKVSEVALALHNAGIPFADVATIINTLVYVKDRVDTLPEFTQRCGTLAVERIKEMDVG